MGDKEEHDMDALECGKKSLMLHTRCGLVSVSSRPFVPSGVRKWFLILAGLLPILVFIMSLVE
jgi:hypothetical protein